MEISEQLVALKERVINLKDKIQTEEATKNALVMPFIQLLGYDIFNPLEVIPEFIADVSSKKGEKVDYCIQKDEEPIIIIECKHWKEKLDLHNTQLERYFAFTKAKFGFLTNGLQYRIFTDLDETNRMDAKPFLEIDFENLKDTAIVELKKFHKNAFDADKIIDSAGELRYYNEIKILYDKELQEPSPELVRHFASQVYDGRMTSSVIEQFTRIVKKALNHKINETINERLKSALNKETEHQSDKEQDKAKEDLRPDEIIVYQDEERGIYTTQEEINAYEVVLDILAEKFGKERIVHRDTKSYLGVLLDDNNRQPLCRLRFNTDNKYLGLFDAEKNETKVQIDKIEHIYKYADKILETASYYENAE